jgi:hypothetical protein
VCFRITITDTRLYKSTYTHGIAIIFSEFQEEKMRGTKLLFTANPKEICRCDFVVRYPTALNKITFCLWIHIHEASTIDYINSSIQSNILTSLLGLHLCSSNATGSPSSVNMWPFGLPRDEQFSFDKLVLCHFKYLKTNNIVYLCYARLRTKVHEATSDSPLGNFKKICPIPEEHAQGM